MRSPTPTRPPGEPATVRRPDFLDRPVGDVRSVAPASTSDRQRRSDPLDFQKAGLTGGRVNNHAVWSPLPRALPRCRRPPWTPRGRAPLLILGVRWPGLPRRSTPPGGLPTRRPVIEGVSATPAVPAYLPAQCQGCHQPAKARRLAMSLRASTGCSPAGDSKPRVSRESPTIAPYRQITPKTAKAPRCPVQAAPDPVRDRHDQTLGLRRSGRRTPAGRPRAFDQDNPPVYRLPPSRITALDYSSRRLAPAGEGSTSSLL